MTFDPNQPNFGPGSQASPAMAREVAQRVVEEVNKRMRTADTRIRALGLACELHAGTGNPPWFVIEQAEALMDWVISGQKPPRPVVNMAEVAEAEAAENV